jgi:hypothetical protein
MHCYIYISSISKNSIIDLFCFSINFRLSAVLLFFIGHMQRAKNFLAHPSTGGILFWRSIIAILHWAR